MKADRPESSCVASASPSGPSPQLLVHSPTDEGTLAALVASDDGPATPEQHGLGDNVSSVAGSEPSPRHSLESLPAPALGATDAGPARQQQQTSPPAANGSAATPHHQHVGQDSTAHGIHWWPPFVMVGCFVFGVLAATSHHVYYAHLNGNIVGAVDDQERNVRVGSFFAFLMQISMSTSVWLAYGQWIWKTMKERPIELHVLDRVFSAETSLLAVLHPDMARKLKVATLLALIAWALQLPALITPATLFVTPSTLVETVLASTLRLNIADPDDGHLFAYSTPFVINSDEEDDDRVRFAGPRSILSRLASATSSLGEILPIAPPFPNAELNLTFHGPYVKCAPSNQTTQALTSAALQQRLGTLVGTYSQVENAYLAFVPSWDVSAGSGAATLDAGGPELVTFNGTSFTALTEPRNQQPGNATNEVWLTYQYLSKNATGYPILASDGSLERRRVFTTCSLYNATYDVHFAFDLGRQTVTPNAITILGPVAFPVDSPDRVSNKSQHAYSAAFWTLADQLVGEMGFFNDTSNRSTDAVTGTIDTSGPHAQAFSSIDTRIEHNSLLGSDDLDYFFLINKRLYNDDLLLPLSDQRLLDKALAKNHTLSVLIEDMMFNMTISLMSDPLLGDVVPDVPVSRTTTPNRYAYSRTNLFVAYGLAILFAALANLLGGFALWHNGAAHDKTLSTILSFTREDRNLDARFPRCCHGIVPQDRRTLNTMLRVVRQTPETLPGGAVGVMSNTPRSPSTALNPADYPAHQQQQAGGTGTARPDAPHRSTSITFAPVSFASARARETSPSTGPTATLSEKGPAFSTSLLQPAEKEEPADLERQQQQQQRGRRKHRWLPTRPPPSTLGWTMQLDMPRRPPTPAEAPAPDPDPAGGTTTNAAAAAAVAADEKEGASPPRKKRKLTSSSSRRLAAEGPDYGGPVVCEACAEAEKARQRRRSSATEGGLGTGDARRATSLWRPSIPNMRLKETGRRVSSFAAGAIGAGSSSGSPRQTTTTTLGGLARRSTAGRSPILQPDGGGGRGGGGEGKRSKSGLAEVPRGDGASGENSRDPSPGTVGRGMNEGRGGGANGGGVNG